MPIILLGVILSSAFLQPWIPPPITSIVFAISLFLKSLITFLLPLVIFGLLFKTSLQLSQKASPLIIFLLVAVSFSNLFSTLLCYPLGSLIYKFDCPMHILESTTPLEPAWIVEFPELISNPIALFLGLALGIGVGKFFPKKREHLSNLVTQGITKLLAIIVFLVPFFISGFLLKMQHDNILSLIFRKFTVIFALVALAVFTYVGFLYLVASRFQKKVFFKSLKNMVPAAVTGFGCMSSAAAMPLTLLGTEKNMDDKDLAQAIIPATVNIHLIGDCFAIPLFAFAVLKNFGMAEPPFITYLPFALFFVLAKFSVAAVPGGGILVMLPLLESYLGLNTEMLSLVTTLYILFDPVITTANVLGNGAFAMVLSYITKEVRFISNNKKIVDL